MTNNQKWFFLLENEVRGPYQEVDIHSLVQQYPQGWVWGQGLNEWVKPEDWQKTIVESKNKRTTLQADPQWKIRQGSFEAGPFVYDEMVQVLKAHPSPGEMEIFRSGDADWKNIYDLPELVEDVGITRRQHHRAPISGLFRYEKAGVFYDSLLTTVSEGGIGILEAQNISVGDVVKGTIQSPQLPTPIPCTCEALYYKHEEGSWGMRFVGLTLESQSLIISYAQKFEN